MVKKPRVCPLCGRSFKPMTDKLWKEVLFEHLVASTKHKLARKEADRIIKEVLEKV